MFFLQTNGSGVLSFAGVSASAGQVIQVLSATDSTERTTTSTPWVTGSNTLTVTITPSSTSNKILILVGSGISCDTYTGLYTLYKNGTTNLGNATYGMAGTSGSIHTTLCIHYVDSPATTSAVTYQVRMSSLNNGTMYLNKNGEVGSITALEIKG